MDRCSSSGDSSPRRERLRSSRKKIKAREKVEKSEHCTFLMFCGSCSQARTAVAQREAHFEVKMLKASKQILKTPDARSTFGSWDFQVSGAVAPSTFGSQNVENTPASEHFWTLRCWKSAHRCCGKHFEVKMVKTHHVRTTFGRSLTTATTATAPATTTTLDYNDATLHYNYNYNYNYTTLHL